MSYYKSPDNAVHWLDTVDYEYLLPAGSKPISDEEAAALQKPKVDEKAIRIAQIEARFAEIDTEGARPAREIALAMLASKTPDAVSVSKLSTLEAEAAALRVELSTLKASS